MSIYRNICDVCGDVTETDSWEPENCPFCENSTLKTSLAIFKQQNQEMLNALKPALNYILWINGDKENHPQKELIASMEALIAKTEHCHGEAEGGVMEEINLAEHCEALEKVIERQQQQIDALKKRERHAVGTAQEWMDEALELRTQVDALKEQMNQLREWSNAQYLRPHDRWEQMHRILGNIPEQSLTEHDREIYNKAVDDVLAMKIAKPPKGYTNPEVDVFIEGAELQLEAICQLKKGE